MEKQQELDQGVTRFFTMGNNSPVVTGNGAAVAIGSGAAAVTGNGSTVVTGAGAAGVTGSGVATTGTNSPVVQGNTKDFNGEVDAAISAIKASDEIEEGAKDSLITMMEDAKEAESEDSEEKRDSVKRDFGKFGKMLLKNAPALVSTLASLTKIAAFFNLTP